MNTEKLVAWIVLRAAAGLALTFGLVVGLDYLGILDAARQILRSVPVMD